MFKRFRKRSTQLEHIDTGNYTPEEYEGCIVELKRVNRWLGDARALRLTLLEEIGRSGQQVFSVLDVGAGSGELLRVVREWAQRNNRQARLVGLELNSRSAQAISRQAEPRISAVRGDALELPFADDAFDYAICSLFTHHFTDDQVTTIIGELARVARRRLFVIDLNRHPMAYVLYTTLGRIVLHNRLLREDGALSILRSFTPEELRTTALRAGLVNVELTRRFPFRLVLSGERRPQHALTVAGNADERMRLAS
jgi:ubiquinone/menaquinone biosynthesis C-methylase UbiE